MSTEETTTLSENTCQESVKDDLNPQKENSAIKDKAAGDAEACSVQSKGKIKTRRKDDCNVQHVLRALNSLTTPEEKLAAMCKKYADLFDENRKLQSTVKTFQKQMAAVIKEKDQARTDLTKSVLTRSRLENLCRELQRQNKIIKEESFQKIREEEEKRKEVSAKFQVTLNEITELMKQDSDKTMKLRDDNIDMTSKLKSIYEQYEIREQQIEKMAKQMALESQLYEAKLSKLEMESAAEKEVLLREKQQLLMTLTEYQARLQEYQNIELALRNQVTLYNNKYEEFEKSLTRSNKMFGGFKEEMENMSDKIIKLERETAAWKLRWEKTQTALLEMASEKKKSDQEIVVATKQMTTLHKLCRTLQSERTQLLAILKQNNISTSTNTTDSDTSKESEEQPKQIVDKSKSKKFDSKAKKSETLEKVRKTKTEPEQSDKKIEPTVQQNDGETLVEEMSQVTLGGENEVIPENNTISSSETPSNPEPCNIKSDSKDTTSADACELKQFPFPQTDTFSFTYNGNILNELKCSPEMQSKGKNYLETKSSAEGSQAFSADFAPSPDKTSTNESQKFVLKKATHSSRRKISPKKKHKK